MESGVKALARRYSGGPVAQIDYFEVRPDDELLELIRSLRRTATGHSGWRAGHDRIHQLLRTATWARQMAISSGKGVGAPWETVLALLIKWHHEIPVGIGEMSNVDASEIGLTALAVARMDELELPIRLGGYSVRKSGNGFVLRHRWDPAVEVADVFLERAAIPLQVPEPSAAEMQWVASDTAWRQVPPIDVLNAAADRAARAVVAYRSALPEGALPDSFDLGEGLTVGHACEILAGLMGLADLSQYAARRRRRTETTLMQLRREQLVDLLAELSPTCSDEQVVLTVDRLTYQRGRTVRNSPLVAIDDRMIISPPLIGSRLVEPLVLRAAAYEPSRFGPIGRQLGRQVQNWVDWLSSIEGVLVATEVKLLVTGGRTAGDLDIVAVDPGSATVVCLEIKTPIDAWSSTEVGKSEEMAAKGAVQLAQRRDQLAKRDATARFPPDWPDVDRYSWTWAVGLPQQLCLRPPPVPEVSITSLRYLLSLGAPPNLQSVARVLRDPPLPVEGTHFTVEPLTVQLERAKIRVDSLAVRSAVVFEPGYTP